MRTLTAVGTATILALGALTVPGPVAAAGPALTPEPAVTAALHAPDGLIHDFLCRFLKKRC